MEPIRFWHLSSGIPSKLQATISQSICYHIFRLRAIVCPECNGNYHKGIGYQYYIIKIMNCVQHSLPHVCWVASMNISHSFLQHQFGSFMKFFVETLKHLCVILWCLLSRCSQSSRCPCYAVVRMSLVHCCSDIFVTMLVFLFFYRVIVGHTATVLHSVQKHKKYHGMIFMPLER